MPKIELTYPQEEVLEILKQHTLQTYRRRVLNARIESVSKTDTRGEPRTEIVVIVDTDTTSDDTSEK